MIGIVVVAHGNLAGEFVKTAQMIAGGDIPGLFAVEITPDESSQDVAKKLQNGISAVNEGDGVIILTDMFGGTPSNVALSFLETGKIEVVSGVNLPMLLQLIEERRRTDFEKFGKMLQKSGREHISLASDLLQGNGNGH